MYSTPGHASETCQKLQDGYQEMSEACRFVGQKGHMALMIFGIVCFCPW